MCNYLSPTRFGSPVGLCGKLGLFLHGEAIFSADQVAVSISAASRQMHAIVP
jgi:hypothetical protein